MNIKIIGCGNIGSNLTYLLLYRHFNNLLKINNLELIDFDTITDKLENYSIYPDLYNESMFKNYYKTDILKKKMMKLFGYDMENIITNRFTKIEDSYDLKTYIKREDELWFDCRDTTEQNSIFNYKIGIDGKNGHLICNPKDIFGKRVPYQIKSIPYYGLILTSHCIEYMLNNYKDTEHKEYIVDLSNMVSSINIKFK